MRHVEDRVVVRVSEARSLVYLHRCFQEEIKAWNGLVWLTSRSRSAKLAMGGKESSWQEIKCDEIAIIC